MSESIMYYFEGESPEMLEAIVNAQATFKFFLRELSWENRRIVPGLDLSVVKMAFPTNAPEAPISHEHMWISDIEFDGKNIYGTLMNEPNYISNLHEGEAIERPFESLEDWMYAIQNVVYGAFTVNTMRKSMEPSEREAHDSAWGLDFGSPKSIELIPKDKFENKSIFSFFKKNPNILELEHPMSINMTEKFNEGIKENLSDINKQFQYGLTYLHMECLAGNLSQVEILLKHGANKEMKNIHNQTALDLAQLMKWEKISKLLANYNN